MNSQKLENILNLSLDSTEEEREKSGILEVGFNREERSWELIVKFHGDISRLADENITVEVLLAGYAIVTLPESLIPALVALEEIEYVEMPKELIYDVYAAKEQSCFPMAGDFSGAAQIGVPGEGGFYFPEGGGGVSPAGSGGGGTVETADF